MRDLLGNQQIQLLFSFHQIHYVYTLYHKSRFPSIPQTLQIEFLLENVREIKKPARTYTVKCDVRYGRAALSCAQGGLWFRWTKKLCDNSLLLVVPKIGRIVVAAILAEEAHAFLSSWSDKDRLLNLMANHSVVAVCAFFDRALGCIPVWLRPVGTDEPHLFVLWNFSLCRRHRWSPYRQQATVSACSRLNLDAGWSPNRLIRYSPLFFVFHIENRPAPSNATVTSRTFGLRTNLIKALWTSSGKSPASMHSGTVNSCGIVFAQIAYRSSNPR